MNYQKRKELSAAFLEDVRMTLDRKGNDYASDKDPFSNFKNTAVINKIHVEKVFTSEITKKVSRIIELLDKPASCESVYDSIRDIAGYACLLDNYLRSNANEESKESAKRVNGKNIQKNSLDIRSEIY